MRRKLIALGCMIGIVGSLYGCGDDGEKEIKVSDDDILQYVDVSTEITGNIYSNAKFSDLQRVFDKNKDVIEGDLFNKKFDTSKLEVQNMYATDETILDTKVSDVFVEKDESAGKVNVVVIHEISSEIDHEANNSVEEDFNDYESNHSHKKDKFLMSVTDRFTFEDGKMTEFKMYR